MGHTVCSPMGMHRLTAVGVTVGRTEYGSWDGNVWDNHGCGGPRLLDYDIIDLYA